VLKKSIEVPVRITFDRLEEIDDKVRTVVDSCGIIYKQAQDHVIMYGFQDFLANSRTALTLVITQCVNTVDFSVI
jgi:predicted lactoylglutathione lyase